MKISSRVRAQLTFQNTSFIILLLAVAGLLAFLSARHSIEADWTMNKRNTLSDASRQLLATLDKPLTFSVYVSEDEELRIPIQQVLKRYQRVNDTIQIQFINPELEPQLVRDLGITVDGEIVIQYAQRQEHIKEASEQQISNAIQRLARTGEHWLVFVEGHGERKPQGSANHDMSEWARQLQNKGVKSRAMSLTENPVIPDNTAALVIASPQVDYLPGEVQIIQQYVDNGGNLLWFAEPGSLHGLTPLAEKLGIQFLDGTVVDPNAQILGINDARVALVSNYPPHQVTQGFEVLTLFPQARALQINKTSEWQSTSILNTLPRSWLETGVLSGNVELDAADVAGPLTLAVAMTRKVKTAAEPSGSTQDTESKDEKPQRVIVMGDGDFLSNTFLGNAGNLELGMNIVNWLSHDDNLIAIPVNASPDVRLDISPTTQTVMAFTFFIFMPLLFAGGGVMVWLNRRKR